jgi:hypothetical protein
MEPLTFVIPTFNEAETMGDAAIREISMAYRFDVIVADGAWPSAGGGAPPVSPGFRRSSRRRA